MLIIDQLATVWGLDWLALKAAFGFKLIELCSRHDPSHLHPISIYLC